MTVHLAVTATVTDIIITSIIITTVVSATPTIIAMTATTTVVAAAYSIHRATIVTKQDEAITDYFRRRIDRKGSSNHF